MSNNVRFRYLVCSDIHFGHRSTPTEHIIRSFKKTVLTKANEDLQALFIAGDLFDHLLYLNTQEAQQVIQFFHYLLNYCHAHDIALKVLEGTPSHDWYQSSLLTKINDVREHKVNLKYFKVLDIEYCDVLQKHILYIPDEWCNSQEELDQQIRTRMMELCIDKVDIAILHGAFRYQAKGIPTSAFLYDEPYFLNLVRGYCHIGHYHVHTTFDRIVAQGSLERLAHGEEAPKGCIRVDGEHYSFIENHNAYIYKTIHIKTNTDLAALDKAIYKYPPNSHIRLSMKAEHPFNTIYRELCARYSAYSLKKLIKEKAPESNSVAYILSEDLLTTAEHFILETNVYEAVMKSVQTKHQLSLNETTKLYKYAEVLDVNNLPLQEACV